MYTIVGYEKDNDIYIKLFESKDIINTLSAALILSAMVTKDELRTQSGEPVDIIQVYECWDQPNEKMIYEAY